MGSAAQISCLVPPFFAKAAGSPRASKLQKNHSTVGQVWPLFEQDKLARGILSKSPLNVNEAPIAVMVESLACLLRWMTSYAFSTS